MMNSLTFTERCFNCDNYLVNFMVGYALWYGNMKSPLVLLYFTVALAILYDFQYKILCL